MNAALAVAAAVLAAGGLSWLEWRRRDRRHLVARIGATLLAVGALALLGWRPTWRRPVPGAAVGGIEAALWTPGAAAGGAADGGKVDARYRFALPGVKTTPAGVTVMPDAATVRRRFPGIGTLHVYGDGLEAFDLGGWRGVRVVFHPPAARGTDAGFSFVYAPRELPLGEPLTVQGRVGGLTPGLSATVTLEAPDGTTTDAKTAPADADGGAGFAVTGNPPPATGRFVWRLRADGKAEESLGVAVVAPDLPRVLVLLNSPRFDTAALRRWFEQAGGTLTARTRVGGSQFRFESAHDPPPQFAGLDAAMLGGFDLVLADGRTLAALPPPERDALRAAMADNGLGLLELADEAVLPGAATVSQEAAGTFFPWKLLPLADAAEGDRLARVQWPGQARPVEGPVPSAPFEIAPQEGQTTLVQDGQGHALAAAFARGRGRLALTLVRETGRWTRENDPGAFAAYWSALFSSLARKTTAAEAGRWMLVDGEAGPVFVDQPVELVWSGKGTPGPGVVDGAALALAADREEPGRWRGTFWPRRSGWQRVAMPSAEGGRPFDFFVAPAGSWPALDAARRQAATARFAEEADTVVPQAAVSAGRENAAVPVVWWWALFLAGAGYLWVERRRVG